MEFAELLDFLLNLGIEEFDPGQKTAAPRVVSQKSEKDPKVKRTNRFDSKQNQRFISAKLRREVWQKYQSCCVSCKSTYALEIDHVRPVALGGKSEMTNLRLTCRSCNQRAALKKLGAEKMEKYLNG